jgi:hypothetical protein
MEERKTAPTHPLNGGRVGPRAGLGTLEKRKIYCLCPKLNHGSLVRHRAAQSPYRLNYPSYQLPLQRRRNVVLYANMNCHSPCNRRPALCSGDPRFDTDVKILVMVDCVLINYYGSFFWFFSKHKTG